MRKTRLTGTHNDKDKSGREHNSSFHSFVSLSVCALTVIAVTGGCKLAGTEKHKVYAASENESSSLYSEDVDYDLPSGIAGVVSGVNATPAAGSTVNRIGISCDDVIVGQRVRKVTSSAVEMNVSESMATTVDTFDAKVVSASSSAKLMSDEDYENLLQIVEAEAGTEDIKGRVLIANVIMNRLSHEEFPDTITGVILDQRNGIPQFSPVYDGKFYEVTVTDETREAVKQALEGTDYSEGALFFVQRSAADKKNVSWFDKDLKKLFKYGVHEFYTYPDEAKSQNTENETSEDDTNVVQMVKK